MKVKLILISVISLILIFSACKKQDETRLQPPDCGDSYCVAAYQMNKTHLADYSAQNVHFQYTNGYALAVWQNTTETPTTTFMLRVGSEQRPVVKGPGIFRFDQYETAYASMRIERDSLLTFSAYAGYIQVDSISAEYFSGSFEVEARVDTLKNYLRFAGKFLVEK
ncbi:MAG: hypothetical protein RBR87_03690 [Bacteroidales bacterium]|jgi:hypothetical protein|nr:hypothetical protein [Bacteroidales bacterium]